MFTDDSECCCEPPETYNRDPHQIVALAVDVQTGMYGVTVECIHCNRFWGGPEDIDGPWIWGYGTVGA